MLNPVRLSIMAQIPKEALEYFRKQGAKGGKKSAAARMEQLTPEKRSAIAKKAAAARWAKAKPVPPRAKKKVPAARAKGE